MPDAHAQPPQPLLLCLEILDSVAQDPAGRTAVPAHQLNPSPTELIFHYPGNRPECGTAIEHGVIPSDSHGKVRDRDADGDTGRIHKVIFARRGDAAAFTSRSPVR